MTEDETTDESLPLPPLAGQGSPLKSLLLRSKSDANEHPLFYVGDLTLHLKVSPMWCRLLMEGGIHTATIVNDLADSLSFGNSPSAIFPVAIIAVAYVVLFSLDDKYSSFRL
ncbi:hypothetical protein OG21DRAFT_1509399 [Imleria badia]|nr:hypothetical protein OG21DRAFT_1509399 [Imleria badia]